MQTVPSLGTVLVLTDDEESGARLSRWIAAAGEQAVVLAGAEKYLMREGDDETVDLLVTDMDTDDPAARSLMDRLAGGELFEGVPQIHLLRDLALRDRLRTRDPWLAAVALPAPAEASEFQARVRLAAEIGRLRRERARISIHDDMTGLFNRRYLLLRLDQEFARARRYRTPLSIVIADVDHLKRINDLHGLEAGDTVIQRVAHRIGSQIRREDVLGRTGEESFGMLLPGNRYRGAAVLANKIRTDVEELAVSYREAELRVRISAGISTFPDHPDVHNADDLVRTAENALAEAKGRGGNRVFIDEAVLRRERRLVVVADGDRSLLDLTEDLLALDDYRIVRAETARALFETIRFRRPDLLIVDLGLTIPEGESSLVERLHGLHSADRFPIIGLSHDPSADPDRMVRFGIDRFITKPFSLSVLRSVARELIELYSHANPSGGGPAGAPG